MASSTASAHARLGPFLLAYGSNCLPAQIALQWRMPRDPFIREKFTRLRISARKLAAEYFERFPKRRYLTEIESWRHLQSDNVEFTMKRLRDPVDNLG